MIPFSSESVHAAIGRAWKGRHQLGREEEIYGLTFLAMLNVVTSRFSLLDKYFARGPGTAGKDFVEDLLSYLLSQLPSSARLAGAGVTSSLRVEQAMTALREEMAQLHTHRMTSEQYARLWTVQDVLTLSLISPYLPSYVRSELAKLDTVVNKAIEERLGPGFGRDDLRKLAVALRELERRGWDWVRPQADVLARYRRLVLKANRLFETSLEHLYLFPPFLVEGPNNEYAIIPSEQPFLWIKQRELEFIDSVRQQHSNVTGDSLERLLEEYLFRRQLVLDNEPPLGLVEVERRHAHHFSSARSSVRLSRNTREDIFSVLKDPYKPEIEIDLLANHPDGFSIIGEVKWVTRYENAETAYYVGTDNKEAERDRLLALSHYLTRNPARKSAFSIPPRNTVIPVFITNAVGPFFADANGVVKACPLEVMEVEPFYRLLKEHSSGKTTGRPTP